MRFISVFAALAKPAGCESASNRPMQQETSCSKNSDICALAMFNYCAARRGSNIDALHPTYP